tara:strand:+ start:155 stop:322 length:168 start_codon:yes stop_codon:yes gene_type:complete
MSKEITITLGKDLQDDFESYLDCCESLEVAPRINAFLNYIFHYGTCTNPRTPEWD